MASPQSNPRTRPEVPLPVRVAVGSVVVGVALHVVGLVVSLIDPGRVAHGSRRGGIGAHAATASAGTVGTVTGVVVTAVVVLVGLFLAVRMYRGANWARVTLTVFAALGLCGVVLVVVGGVIGEPLAGSAPSIVVRALIGAAEVVFLVVAYRRPAGDYFAGPAGRRRMPHDH